MSFRTVASASQSFRAPAKQSYAPTQQIAFAFSGSLGQNHRNDGSSSVQLNLLLRACTRHWQR